VTERTDQADAPETAPEKLRSLLLGPDGSEPLLSEMARWAAGQVEDTVSCGITVSAAPGTPRLGASSDELARRMAAIQYVLEDGPCLSAIREQVEVRIGTSVRIAVGWSSRCGGSGRGSRRRCRCPWSWARACSVR
jgi:hypothetical protein